MTSGLHHLPSLLVAMPLVAAALLGVLGHWLPRAAADLVAVLTAGVCAAGGVWLAVTADGAHAVEWIGGWLPDHAGDSVGVVLVADGLAAGLVALAGGITCLALAHSWRYLAEPETTYHALMLLFLGAVTGFVLAGDLFDAFVWFELMGAAGYALTGMRVEEPRSVQAGLRFAVVNTLGASFALVGIALLYARTGELNLASVGARLAEEPPDALVGFAWAALLTGVLAKAAVVPFHFWTADAEAAAPSPVCAVLSGVMVTTGVYAVARWWWVLFDGVLPSAPTRVLLLILGAATALVGAVMCPQQRHIKRLLAYSTISHVGVALLAVGLLDEHGLAAAGAYLLGHGFTKAALFLVSAVLLDHFETVDEHALFGRGCGMVVTGLVFATGGLALAGLPALGLWWGKSAVEDAVIRAQLPWLVAVVVVAGALTGGAVLRTTARVFLGLGVDPRTEREPDEHEVPEERGVGRGHLVHLVAPSVVGLAAATVLGLVPTLHQGLADAAAAFVDASAYDAAVRQPGTPPIDSTGVVTSPWATTSVLLALLTTLLALGTAAAWLWGPRAARPVRDAVAWLRPAAVLLHRAHRVDVGTQVAWVVLGAGVLSVALAR